MYSAVITKSGQVTLPKELRDFLGVKPGEKITFNKDATGITIRRRLTDEEFTQALDANISPKTRKLIKKHAGKTVNELMTEYMQSPKGQKEMRRKYAI